MSALPIKSVFTLILIVCIYSFSLPICCSARCKFVPLASALLGSTQEEIEKHIHSRKLSKAKDGDVAVVISRHKKYKHIPSNNGTKEDIELKKTLKQEFDHLKKCRDDNMDKQPKAKKPKAK